ncbi:P-II family nitrogen regulator [Methylococcus sp. EFPC2]|uniref:P-II family nitrogen regulator n=1 Tax=Methylococcus sp. EFPC2 TaxID=2812648 RepID=UPI001967F31E|nr:P-II family nitrogen regulator [Methylococcus sp. EFPC2]QSA95850.1 P-II family nitrogen regulator [Methylococcus sp. EFPC2]
MKVIKAVIQPHKLELVREALTAVPEFPGMTISRVDGCGPALDKEGHDQDVREQLTDFSHKVRLEILAPDEIAGKLAELIHRVAHTGQTGDGIVWITAVESFERIRFPVAGS